MKNTSETTKRLNLKLNFILCLMSQIVKHEILDHLRYPMTLCENWFVCGVMPSET